MIHGQTPLRGLYKGWCTSNIMKYLVWGHVWNNFVSVADTTLYNFRKKCLILLTLSILTKNYYKMYLELLKLSINLLNWKIKNVIPLFQSFYFTIFNTNIKHLDYGNLNNNKLKYILLDFINYYIYLNRW